VQVKFVDGFQTYDDPPDAFNIILFPEQMVGDDGFTVIVNPGDTITLIDCKLEQPVVVPVMLYVVVVVGLAVTEDPVEEFNEVLGDQVYEAAPLTLRVTLFPGHIVGFDGVTLMVGVAFTVRVIVCGIPIHPDEVPVTVYVVVVVGFAITLTPVEAFNDPLGDQV
jgi:hypothetical protein